MIIVLGLRHGASGCGIDPPVLEHGYMEAPVYLQAMSLEFSDLMFCITFVSSWLQCSVVSTDCGFSDLMCKYNICLGSARQCGIYRV